MYVSADEAERRLGPGVPQRHAGATAEAGGFGRGEHGPQTAEQQTAAETGAPTSKHCPSVRIPTVTPSLSTDLGLKGG